MERKYRITSHVLEELEAQGVPPDVLAILEGFREFERDQALFSSLVARDIGSEQWNRYATQILKAARITSSDDCDSDLIWSATFKTLQQMGPMTSGELGKLQQIPPSGCRLRRHRKWP